MSLMSLRAASPRRRPAPSFLCSTQSWGDVSPGNPVPQAPFVRPRRRRLTATAAPRTAGSRAPGAAVEGRRAAGAAPGPGEHGAQNHHRDGGRLDGLQLMDVIDVDDRARTWRLACDLRLLRRLWPASAVCAHVSSTPGRERPAGAAARATIRGGRAGRSRSHSGTDPSAIARAGGAPRRPLGSLPALYQSGAESLTAHAIGRPAREAGRDQRRHRSPQLRTTARNHAVPPLVLIYFD
jgi:hypothetical protein